MMRIPKYRVWAGLAIWFGMSVIDIILHAVGVLCAVGFIIPVLWSIHSQRVEVRGEK